MHRISTGSKGFACFTSVGSATSFFAVHYVRGNCEYRLSRYSTAVGFVLANFVHEALHKFDGQTVCAIVIIAVFWIFSFDRVIYGQTLLVANHFNFSVFNRRERVRHHRQSGNSAGHCPVNIAIVQCHFQPFVAVFVVHVVNDIQRIDIRFCQPRHHFLEPRSYLVIIEIFGSNRWELRRDLVAGLLIFTAVNRIEQSFSQVNSRAEKLHLLANSHRGDTTGDRVIIAVLRTHQVVVFVLNRTRLAGYLGTEFFEVFRQVFRPQNGEIWFWCSTEV